MARIEQIKSPKISGIVNKPRMKGEEGGDGVHGEEELQQLRSRATELLLRGDWKEYINLYTHFISLHCCQENEQHSNTKLHKALCSAFSNRAEARFRLQDLSAALDDCERALQLEPVHHKALLCKGRILLELNRYSQASECFKEALASHSQANGSIEMVREMLERSKKLQAQARTGALDLSDWILNGFDGRPPELAEYVGPLEIKRSEAHGGRGLFATKKIETGTPLIITKAVVIGRGILPVHGDESGESARLVMWKAFVDKILDATARCSRTLWLIYTLSTGDNEGDSEVPDMALFHPYAGEVGSNFGKEELDVERVLKALDVNCLMEDAVCAKVLGKNNGYSGVGLWILPAFVNHSCSPNARRVHIGDRVVVHASRDVKEGEEITFAYFDVLVPLNKRQEMGKKWGFQCNCERCEFEEKAPFGEEIREMQLSLKNGQKSGDVVVRLEEKMKKWIAVKAKEKGFLRASFWEAYSDVYASDKLMRRWGKQIPLESLAAESIVGAVGGDERVLKVVVGRWKKKGRSLSIDNGMMEMEKVMRLARGVYGKVFKKQVMGAMLELAIAS